MRIAIGIEYDGTAYNGWQRQRSGVGIQALVEHAASQVANHEVEAVCAGRTDAGVHATAQVAHFDTGSERSDRSWLLGLNANLPDDINVTWARPVKKDFHARYSALARTYRYLILNRLVRSALFRKRAWWMHQALDAERMEAAGQLLIGEHDFSAFRAAGCQAKTPMRELRRLEVRKAGDWIAITVEANAFLQHMVRNISGLLVAVGSGEHPPEWAREVLMKRDRRAGHVAAPPHGLTFVGVTYPVEYEIPAPGFTSFIPGGP